MSQQSEHLARKMEARHIRMISLGGVIGTGLFLSSGYTIHEAGPLGTILAYLVGAILVYAVMLCLGELSVAMPYTGAFHVYAKQFIGPATGFTVAVLYWLTWTIALGSEFTAAGLIMQEWFPHTPVWIWSTIFIILIFLSNAYSVKVFAESEFWFSAIKVFAIVAFILLGILAMVGIIPLNNFTHAPGISNLYKNGIFPNGFSGVFIFRLNSSASPSDILAPVLHKMDDTLHVLRLVENLVSDLRVSQRSVVAERLQGAGTDAQLLADFLVVHPTAELPFFSLADDFIHPVGQEIELADHFLVLSF